MMMKHEELEQLLGRYFEGTLSEAEKDRIETHAAGCTVCTESVHRAIDERELIDRYILHKLMPGEKEFLEKHYIGCAECFTAIQEAEYIISGLLHAKRQDMLSPRVEGRRVFEEARLHRLRTQFLPASFSPAYALAVLVLLLIYPAWQGLVDLPRLKHELERWQKPQANSQVHMLLPLRGSEGSDPIFFRATAPENAGTLVLQFMLGNRLAPDSRFNAMIQDQSTEKIIWEEPELRSSNEYELYAIACPSSFFSPGRFQLNIQEVDRNSARVLQEVVFPFEVK